MGGDSEKAMLAIKQVWASIHQPLIIITKVHLTKALNPTVIPKFTNIFYPWGQFDSTNLNIQKMIVT